MERMFRKKIAVRVDPPTSSSVSPFFQIQLRTEPSPASSLPNSPLSDPDHFPGESISVKVESLCWKLSRAFHVACLCFSHSLEVIVVYKRSQLESANHVAKEIRRRLPVGFVGIEEEVTSGSAVAQALECNLRCVFLDNNWTCLGGNLFVHSGFSLDDERNHLCALDVKVQLDVDDRLTLLVSPDVVLFRRYKMSDLLDLKTETKFYNGDEVILGDLNSVKYCHILPYLCEGYVRGVRKGRSLTDDQKELLELWSFKHGLAMLNDHFIKIQFGSGDCAREKWFPSAVVLRGSGLFPAPKTARMMKTVSGLTSFMKIIEAWNFFGQGLPKVKVLNSFDINSETFTWRNAINAVANCISRDNIYPFEKFTSNNISGLMDLFTVNDFRTPKPSHHLPSSRIILQIDEARHRESVLVVSTDKLKLQFQLRKISKENIPSVVRKAPGGGDSPLTEIEFSTSKPTHCIVPSNKKLQKDEASHGESMLAASIDKLKPQFQVRKFSKENIPSVLKNAPGDGANPSLKETEERADQSSKSSGINQKITGTCSEATQAEERISLADAEASNSGKITGGKIKSVSQKKLRRPADGMSSGNSPKEDPHTIPKERQSPNAIQDQRFLSSKNNLCTELYPNTLVLSRNTEPPSAPPANRKMDKKEVISKRKQSAPSDRLEMSSKVLECHSKGKLGSLTVTELKSFLSMKKAKVGGKKEELVLRVTSLLG